MIKNTDKKHSFLNLLKHGHVFFLLTVDNTIENYKPRSWFDGFSDWFNTPQIDRQSQTVELTKP